MDTRTIITTTITIGVSEKFELLTTQQKASDLK